jgi:hypothetical protein
VIRGLALALLVPAAWAVPLRAQSHFWREDERVIVTDLSVIQAIAASETRVYVAGTDALGLYDHRFHQWAPPVTEADGYPHEPITVALADPAEEAVWLGTATAVVRYRPTLREFERFLVPGGARDLAFDRDDPLRGLFILAAGGWQLLPRGGFATSPASPPRRSVHPLRADEIDARIPFLQTMGAAALLDERLRQFQLTSATRVPNTEVYFLGTNGMGIVKVDALMATIEPVPYGLLSPGASAVLAVQNGVWVGSDERATRPGLTFVADDLQQFAFEEGPRGTGFGASVVRALALRGDEVWAGTDQGIVRVEPGGTTRRLQHVDGLPDNDTYALARSPSRLWVGTARGLAYVPGDTVRVERTDGPAVPALAVVGAGDSAWVGLTEGLGLALPDGQLFLAPGADTLPELREPVVAIALRADTLVVATANRLVWRAGSGGWTVERILSEVAPISALVADSGGLWVGGQVGLARVHLATHVVRAFPVPRDVPAAVRAIATTQRYVWVATESGLVRFSRDAVDR